MEQRNILIQDYAKKRLTVIVLSDKELKEAEGYDDDDFEEFLSTLEKKYDFSLSNSEWMRLDELSVRIFKDESLIMYTR